MYQWIFASLTLGSTETVTIYADLVELSLLSYLLSYPGSLSYRVLVSSLKYLHFNDDP
jgi:hypothetical protein